MQKEYADKYIVLGLNIRFYRKVMNYTQAELAERLGIDATHLGRIEAAKVGASLDVVFGVADILDISVEKLFTNRYGEVRK